MRQSELFAKTKKGEIKTAEAISHQLLVRADFIEQTAAGVYSFLPLGFRVLKKIEAIIREEMIAVGGQEVLLPALIPKNLWQKTERWEKIEPPLFKLKDIHGKYFGLGSTHEEIITELARTRIQSYKDLPQNLFQIQDKFRNEVRPKAGLLRTREFLMKDLYSFHPTEKEALAFYEKMKSAYFRIFRKCELEVFCVEAESGTIGGSLSHEFMVLSETGEDKIKVCEKCSFGANIEKIGDKKLCPQCRGKLKEKRGIEVGHIFYLGEKYSQVLGSNFIDKKGNVHPVMMGCYGIGFGRLLATIVEVHHDKRGIIWPKDAAPFLVHLIAIEEKQKVRKTAEKLYQDLQKLGVEVLYDDREGKTVGEKFADCDLIGIPLRIVVSEKTLKKGSVEMKKRGEKKIKLAKISKILSFLKK